MKNTVMKEKGITLVILVITIVVLAILATTVVTLTKNTLDDTKIYSFVTELEVIEKKMYVINKEIALGSTAYEDVGTKYDDLDSATQEKIQVILNENSVSDYSNYRYLEAEKGDLLKLGLKNINQDVIISYDNSVVYSYNGLFLDGEIYHTIEQVQAVQNVQ